MTLPRNSDFFRTTWRSRKGTTTCRLLMADHQQEFTPRHFGFAKVDGGSSTVFATLNWRPRRTPHCLLLSTLSPVNGQEKPTTSPCAFQQNGTQIRGSCGATSL